MSSKDIKVELADRFEGTTAAQWKRTSKRNVQHASGPIAIRTFVNDKIGMEVVTMGEDDEISILEGGTMLFYAEEQDMSSYGGASDSVAVMFAPQSFWKREKCIPDIHIEFLLEAHYGVEPGLLEEMSENQFVARDGVTLTELKDKLTALGMVFEPKMVHAGSLGDDDDGDDGAQEPEPVAPAPAPAPTTPAAAPAPEPEPEPISKAAKTAAPSLKALMKKGTKWRVKTDSDIHVWVQNPDYWPHVHKNPYPGGPQQMAWNDQMAEVVYTKVATLKAGTVLTVFDKMITDLFNDAKRTRAGAAAGLAKIPPGNGHGVPVRFQIGENELLLTKQGGGIGHFDVGVFVPEQDGTAVAILPYKVLEPIIEAEGEIAEQFIYLLRDKNTGLFYRMPNHEVRHHVTNPEFDKWQAERDKITGPHGPGFNMQAGYDWEETHPRPSFGGYKIKPGVKPEDCFYWEAKPTKAKQYADIGKMKSSILTFVGYHTGLTEDSVAEGSEWLHEMRDSGDDEGFPFLPSFEAVKLEKFTKKEVEIIDIQSWYERTMRLRRITATYGSSVRGLYNKLEKSGELDDWHYVVVFKTGKTDQWGDRTVEITPAQADAIDATIVQLGHSPKKLKRAKAVGSLSVVVDSLSTAFGLKMGQDDLQTAIIDLKTMQEMVQE